MNYLNSTTDQLLPVYQENKRKGKVDYSDFNASKVDHLDDEEEHFSMEKENQRIVSEMRSEPMTLKMTNYISMNDIHSTR